MTDPAGTATPLPLGHWTPAGEASSDAPDSEAATFAAALGNLRSPVVVVRTDRGFAVAPGGSVTLGPAGSHPPLAQPVAAFLPSLPPEQLGDPTFRRDHALKYAYMTGAM